MITLMLSTITNYPEFYRIIGYVLTVVEVLMIIVRLLYNFTPEDSKFSNFLKLVFKGLKKSKHTLNNPTSEDLKEKVEIETTEEDKGE